MSATQTHTESLLRPEDAIFRETVRAGDPFIHPVKAGQTVRILDLEGNQAADTLFYNSANPLERYSSVDTIREQANIYLTTGTKLMSTEGRVTLGGACASESNMIRYALEKKFMHSCRDSFLLGLMCCDPGKLPAFTEVGMSKRDITSNINFFMNVPVTPEGRLTFEDGISHAGKYVELKAAMDVAILLSNCPQLNNPCNAYNPTPVEVLIWE